MASAPTPRRDVVVAFGSAAAVMGLMLFGLLGLLSEQGKPSPNQLTGFVVAKNDTGERERRITFGKEGLKSREGDSGYSLEVRVDPPGRLYHVPVERALFEAKSLGDTLTFIRPPSEQE